MTRREHTVIAGEKKERVHIQNMYEIGLFMFFWLV